MQFAAGIYYQHGCDLAAVVIETDSKEVDHGKCLLRPLSTHPPTTGPQTQQLKSELSAWIESRLLDQIPLKIAAPFLDSERPKGIRREDVHDTEPLTKDLQEVYLPCIKDRRASRANYGDITPGKTAINAMKVAYLTDNTEFIKALMAAIKPTFPNTKYDKLPAKILNGHTGFAIGLALIQGLLGAKKPITLTNLKHALEKTKSTKPRDIQKWQAIEASLRTRYPNFQDYLAKASGI